MSGEATSGSKLPNSFVGARSAEPADLRLTLGTNLLPRLAIVPLWIGALWSSLQIHRLALDFGHSICGPWGCGPPTEALVGYHGFWFALILPAAMIVAMFCSSSLNRKIGLAVLFAGLLGTLTFVGWDLWGYLRAAETAEHVWQRAMFTLVTTVDFPMMQTITAGLVMAFVFGRKSATAEPTLA